MHQPQLRAPFPYFGGKSKVAGLVWQRLGDARNYVEPFVGSAAMLLQRPHYPFTEGRRTETINDCDCFLANFWRALQAAPDEVAEHCDWPVNEADLHARHYHLVNIDAEHVQRLRREPRYYDARIAGWWVWGACQWIGTGWCHNPHWIKRPHLGDEGMGVHRLGQQLPHLGDEGRGVHRPGDSDLHEYLAVLSARLRRVRVCCGDWSRVCGPTPTTRQGLTAVFLDPPYTAAANREARLYAHDDLTVGQQVAAWALEHGDDPQFRIAVCGYVGEYAFPDNWECVPWKATGGYGNQARGATTAKANAHRERIWFSPHCLQPTSSPPTSRAKSRATRATTPRPARRSAAKKNDPSVGPH